MPKIVKCLICGKEFQTARANKKYCSFSCREAGQTARRIKWKLNNPDYMSIYMKQYKKKNTPSILPEN